MYPPYVSMTDVNSVITATNILPNVSTITLNSHGKLDGGYINPPALVVNGISVSQWMSTINGILGLPERDMELEKSYPQLTTIWYDAVAEIQEKMKDISSEKSLEYVKKCDQYKNFDILKK